MTRFFRAYFDLVREMPSTNVQFSISLGMALLYQFWIFGASFVAGLANTWWWEPGENLYHFLPPLDIIQFLGLVILGMMGVSTTQFGVKRGTTNPDLMGKTKETQGAGATTGGGSMMLKEGAIVALVCLVVAAGFNWRSAYGARVLAEEQLRQNGLLLESATQENVRLTGVAVDATMRANREAARADSVGTAAARQVAAARREVQRVEPVVAQAVTSAEANMDTLRARVEPGLVPVVDSAGAQFGRALDGKDIVIAAERSRAVAGEGQVSALQAALSASQQQCFACAQLVDGKEQENVALRERVAILDELANPSWLERVQKSALSHLITAGGFYLAGVLTSK